METGSGSAAAASASSSAPSAGAEGAPSSASSASSRPSSANTPLAGFSPERCAGYFQECSKHLHDIPIEPFLLACEEIKTIVGTLGTALSIASADITEKVGVINQRLKDMREVAKSKGVAAPLLTEQAADPADQRVHETLQWMVRDEVSRNVATRNDWSYAAGTYHLSRLLWFLDFVYELLGHLVDNLGATAPPVPLKESASLAYERALAPHHPWILRKTISAALTILPAKEHFLRHLAGPNGSWTAPDFPDRIRSFLTTIQPVRSELWGLYSELGLKDKLA